ncbi:MAG: hypothetical protein WA885_04220 [Phormidesmis sp.]
MTTVNFSRRVSSRTITTDIAAYHGLSTVTDYVPTRNEATPKNIKSAYDAMLAKQKRETELAAMLKAASDAARQSEVDFHSAVLAMKESIRGQFGPNSDEAQAVGYKKKSEYKRPRRRSA